MTKAQLIAIPESIAYTLLLPSSSEAIKLLLELYRLFGFNTERRGALDGKLATVESRVHRYTYTPSLQLYESPSPLPSPVS